MPLPYPTKVVLPFDIATAQDMNERHANDVALANGSGLDDGAVTSDKLDLVTYHNTVSLSSGLGTKVLSFGFKPRIVSFTLAYDSPDNSYTASGMAVRNGETFTQSGVASAANSTNGRRSVSSSTAALIGSGVLSTAYIGRVISFNNDGITIDIENDNSSFRSWQITAW